jgi:hypothetical protein
MANHAEGAFCWIAQQQPQAQNFAVGRLDRLLPEQR